MLKVENLINYNLKCIYIFEKVTVYFTPYKPQNS